MYLNHYNLNLKPFEMSPDPRFLWLGEKHKEALAALEYGILESKGFLLLNGDAGTGKTVEGIEHVVPAAFDGRIDTMFVDESAHQWGCFATDSRFVEVHEELQQGDEDLLDLAAVETLAHQGTVYAVGKEAMPTHAAAAALLRY